jgi:hypothetical protein
LGAHVNGANWTSGRMRREIAIKNLAQAEQIIALGLKHIADQEARMKCLDGDDLANAEGLLKAFRQSQALHVEHRDRLQRELGMTLIFD